MLIRLLDQVRCRVGHWLVRSGMTKGIAIAKAITPGPAGLVTRRPRRPPPLRVPERSHLIYHQGTVDELCARNSLETIAAQLPVEDEVLFLDVGGTLSPDVLAAFSRHAWRTYSACAAEHPEQRSYTYGLNTSMRALKAPVLVVWRTDYVYPADLLAGYRRHVDAGAGFAVPYEVRIGHPHVDSRFVRDHWDRVMPYDRAFWEPISHRNSLYETQDPALFAIRRELWEKIGGLNHELWGYGWQFAEFAQRVRQACSPRRIAYFGTTPPLHQTHEGTMMHRPPDRPDEMEAGIERFRRFLGGEAAYRMFRLKDRLPPCPPR